jgi:hypothetical protein
MSDILIEFSQLAEPWGLIFVAANEWLKANILKLRTDPLLKTDLRIY